MKILIAEDDRDFGNILSQYIALNGHEVILARDGNEAFDSFRKEKPDICVLDVMMPEIGGFTLAARIRSANPGIPFIFLTAKSMKEDIVKGLKLGADDYITKPFDPEVLILRLNLILKRCYPMANDEYSLSSTILKYSTLELKSPSGTVKLTLREAQLLRYLVINKNRALTRDSILREIWGEDDYFLGRSMDVFISRLRKYLAADKGIELQTVRGAGFILKEI